MKSTAIFVRTAIFFTFFSFDQIIYRFFGLENPKYYSFLHQGCRPLSETASLLNSNKFVDERVQRINVQEKFDNEFQKKMKWNMFELVFCNVEFHSPINRRFNTCQVKPSNIFHSYKMYGNVMTEDIKSDWFHKLENCCNFFFLCEICCESLISELLLQSCQTWVFMV